MGKMADFYTVESVVNAYEEQGIPAFGLFHDGQLKTRFNGSLEDGSAYLEKILDRLNSPDNYAIYTLAFYDGISEKVKINDKTAKDSSFNFQLNKNNGLGRVGATPADTYTREQAELMAENKLLKKELEDLRDTIENSAEAAGQVNGIVGQIMAIPGITELIGSISSKIGEGISSIGRPPGGDYMRRVSGISDLDMTRPINGAPGENGEAADFVEAKVIYNELYREVDILAESVKDLEPLVKKLNYMNRKSPVVFWAFVNGLRVMKI